MPWTATDNYQIRKYLGISPYYKAYIQGLMDAAEAEAIVDIQAMLTDLATLDTQVAALATADDIKELVGDIVFADGDKRAKLTIRTNQLVGRLCMLLGVDLDYVWPAQTMIARS